MRTGSSPVPTGGMIFDFLEKEVVGAALEAAWYRSVISTVRREWKDRNGWPIFHVWRFRSFESRHQLHWFTLPQDDNPSHVILNPIKW
jgi:hypothetical protein